MNDQIESPPIGKVRSGYTTLTMATEDMLRQAIQEGRFPPGSQLPSEMELISILGVSRSTLREAMRSLEENQLIVRKRGLGTFVSERSILKDLSINFGITEMIRQAGMTPGAEKVTLRSEKAPSAIAKALKLPESGIVVVIERIRTADKRPVVWSQDIIPDEILGDHAIEPLFLESHSVYQYLETYLQIQISHGVAQIRPVATSAEIADRLNIHKGTPLLRIDQTDYDISERPVLYSIEHHLPDAFVFIVNRRGPHW
jgi:DNA-binding GntR family transcriptional regulator